MGAVPGVSLGTVFNSFVRLAGVGVGEMRDQ